MIKLFVILFILLLIDVYVFKGIKLLMNNSKRSFKLIVNTFYWLVSLFLIYKLADIIINWTDFRVNHPDIVRFWASIFFVVLFSKFEFAFFHLISDAYLKVKSLLLKPKPIVSGTTKNDISRAKFITQIGVIFSAFVFGSFSYGVKKGRYAFKLRKEKIYFNNLPLSFSGLKIVQISDLHLGSFVNDFAEVEKAIKLINDQKPDLIFFTGDMVNVHADEAEPWIDIFSKLEAKIAKYSIFGNHDYCDYGKFTEEESQKSIQKLKTIHKKMGFRLLEDENVFLTENKEKIAIAGMHNWGRGLHQIGDLEKAIEGLQKEDFTLLLSHDPTLWEEKIKNKKAIDLTFSGHTHGMQLGVKIPFTNIEFSPIRLRYKYWGGLYEHNKKYIYVNRGFGFIGFPGRVGMNPEIAVIELFKS